MGRWYRRAKRLNLKPLVNQSDCEFVFDAFGISIEELSGFQSSFAGAVAPQRLCLGIEPVARHEQILIVPEGIGELTPAARLRDGWRGIIIVPRPVADRRSALFIFFLKQSRYRIGNHSWVTHYKGRIPPFLLDLTANPALFMPQEPQPQQTN
jgi:hypothetical protein